MTDEKFLFIQDVRDKKMTARSSHNRRTHTGKSGGVKLPSDYLTKKEREKMNGQPTTYRISQPMAWQEFKAMPDDLQAAYINWLREKFNVPDSKIAGMFGVCNSTLCGHIKKIGCPSIKHRSSATTWDSEGFAAWRNGAASDAAERAEETAGQEKETVRLDPIEEVAPIAPVEVAEETTPAQIKPLRPVAGAMQFDGPADHALQIIGNVLRGAHVRLYVSWAPIPTEDTASPDKAKG